MKTINALLEHGQFSVRELGQKAVQYQGQLERKEITPDEYANLRAQLLDLDALEKAAASAEERQALAEAVQFLARYLPMVL